MSTVDSAPVLAILFWLICWLFFYAYAFNRRILVKLHSLMTFGAIERNDLLRNENFIAKCHMGAFASGVGGIILTVVLIRKFVLGI